MTHGNVLGYSAASGTVLDPLSGSPFPAGNQPSAIAIDPTTPMSTSPTRSIPRSRPTPWQQWRTHQLGTYPTGLQPVAIGIDPSTNHFLYTVNYLGSRRGTVRL